MSPEEARQRHLERRRSHKWVAGHGTKGLDKTSWLAALFAPHRPESLGSPGRETSQVRSREEIDETVKRLYSRAAWLQKEYEVRRNVQGQGESLSPGLRLVMAAPVHTLPPWCHAAAPLHAALSPLQAALSSSSHPACALSSSSPLSPENPPLAILSPPSHLFLPGPSL